MVDGDAQQLGIEAVELGQELLIQGELFAGDGLKGHGIEDQDRGMADQALQGQMQKFGCPRIPCCKPKIRMCELDMQGPLH